MSRLGRTFAAALVGLAAACSLRPVEVEPRLETISRLPSGVAIAATLPATLLVMPVETNAAYDTARMAYTARPNELAYFARSEWAEKPAGMLQDLLVRTLERTRRFHAVVRPPYAGPAAYALRAEMVELRQDFVERPAAVSLVLRAELREGASGRAIATHEFEAREPMAEASPQAGAAAANAAAARVLGELARFVVDHTG